MKKRTILCLTSDEVRGYLVNFFVDLLEDKAMLREWLMEEEGNSFAGLPKLNQIETSELAGLFEDLTHLSEKILQDHPEVDEIFVELDKTHYQQVACREG
jgi:hypothetical protein